MNDAELKERNLERLRYEISGLVQGVGFRPFLHHLAGENKLTGWVRNNFAGIELEVQGEPQDLAAFSGQLKLRAPVTAALDEVIATPIPVIAEEDFRILPSEFGELLGSPIPDQGICEACQSEFFDPADRRYHYPLISCAVCGPRFTIIEELPFDRNRTSMDHFKLCPACLQEYTNPANRRFHAQTTACAECGPRIWFSGAAGCPSAADPGPVAVETLLAGGIIGIKGIGGYHLACNAFSGPAVERLRKLKGRDQRPFAVMFKDLETVKSNCRLTPAEERALISLARPIVLLSQKSDSNLAREINPGLTEIGAFLPYTGIHLLLFNDAITALVMTSGNRSGEPLSIDEASAFRDLGPMVAGFLNHNREIKWRADDSVIRVQRERLIGIRRSRGYAPAPIKLGKNLAPLLACGAQQKNTFALTKGDRVYLSPHQGDLDNLASFLSYQETIQRFQCLLKCKPEWAIHDLHPDYNSTVYALGSGLKTLGAQHHLAHIATVIAAQQIKGPVIGVAFDGSGYGTDGKLWGGEFLVGQEGSWRRAGHLKYYPLPGGEAAAHEPWRMAASYLETADPEKLREWLTKLGLEAQWLLLRKAMKAGINAPETSSIGRLFDGLAALTGGPIRVTYEGEAAIWLENQADSGVLGSYNFQIYQELQGFLIDPAPLLAEVLTDLTHEGPGVISMRFHRAVARMIRNAAAVIRQETGIDQVILSGGVFQNRLLLELTWGLLEESGMTVWVPELVPGNDGGIALGQAWLGNVMIERGINDVFGGTW